MGSRLMTRLMVLLMTLPTWAEIGLAILLGLAVASFAIVVVPV